jgi:cytochrome b561
VFAKATHWVMYALIVSLVVLGLALWWVRGDTWFFVWAPAPASWSSPPVSHFIDHWHGTLANVLMILAGIHAFAAIFHRLVLRDGVLARMVVRHAR